MNWPTRRTPAFALIGSLVGIVVGLIISHRQTEAAERMGSELGTLVGTRWKEGDQREFALLTHTRALKRLTVIVVICTIVSTAFVMYAALKQVAPEPHRDGASSTGSRAAFLAPAAVGRR